MPSVSSTNPNQATKPIRILHVVGGMDRGGVETWLMHVLRQLKAVASSDTRRFQMDFLAPEDRNYAYTDELQALGSQIFSVWGYLNRCFMELIFSGSCANMAPMMPSTSMFITLAVMCCI